MKRIVPALMLCAATLVTAFPAAAQGSYPSRPIKWIVPYPPGGGASVAARLVQEEVSAQLGQPIIIENRPGAAGAIGTMEVSRAKPDGYTMVILTTTNVVAPAVNPNWPSDTMKEFVPVATLIENSSILTVNASIPAKTVPELVALLKANPGKYNFGNAGVGGVNHLTTELFKRLTQTEFTQMPYNGTGPMVGDLLAGNVHATFESPEAVMSHIRSGRIRALGVASTTRIPTAPDIPLLPETLPGMVNVSFSGLAAPAGTPRAVVDKMAAAVAAAVKSPAVQQRLRDMGSTGGRLTDDFGRLMQTEIDKWKAVASESKIVVKPQ